MKNVLTEGDLAAIRAIIVAELDRRNLKRSPDITAAERMRRYRAKKSKQDRNVTSRSKRNASEINTVTLRNGSVLPEWMPGEAWNAYVRHRAALKKPLTEDGARLAVKALDKLRAQGQDVSVVLEQSVANGWQGLFPVRVDKSQKDGIAQWLAQQERDITSESIRES